MGNDLDGVSIFIPVLNEEVLLAPSVTKVHDYLTSRGIVHEIIVVDNGSTDSTWTLAQQLEQAHSWFRCFHLPARGIGRAFAFAVPKATYDNIVSVDIDLPTDLIFIEYARDLLKHGDLIVGSKVMGNQRRAWMRVVGSQLYILVAQLFFGLTISDYAPSTKAFRRSAILPALPHIDPWTAYVFELCVFCRLRGKRIIQIGVDCEDRRKSRFNLIHEGFYRYLHLFRCALKVRDRNSWFYVAE